MRVNLSHPFCNSRCLSASWTGWKAPAHNSYPILRITRLRELVQHGSVPALPKPVSRGDTHKETKNTVHLWRPAKTRRPA